MTTPGDPPLDPRAVAAAVAMIRRVISDPLNPRVHQAAQARAVTRKPVPRYIREASEVERRRRIRKGLVKAPRARETMPAIRLRPAILRVTPTPLSRMLGAKSKLVSSPPTRPRSGA